VKKHHLDQTEATILTHCDVNVTSLLNGATFVGKSENMQQLQI